MEIAPFQNEHIPEAAQLFVRNYAQLRQQVPALPERMEDTDRVGKMLASIMKNCSGVAAVEHGRLIGYLSWFLVDGFRGTDRKAAYCPEWGHGAVETGKVQIYRALYQAASAQWAEAGCQTHALTLLAHDRTAVEAWFWNGFGLTVVDAVRSLNPIGARPPQGFAIRKAIIADAEKAAAIEAEHWQHYEQPPVFMVAHAPDGTAELAELIGDPKNSIWLAERGTTWPGSCASRGAASAPPTWSTRRARSPSPARTCARPTASGVSSAARWILSRSTPRPPASGRSTSSRCATPSCVCRRDKVDHPTPLEGWGRGFQG